MGISVALAGISAFVAASFYIKHPERPKAIAQKLGKAYELVYNKYFVDEAYFAWIINPLVNLSKGIWYYIDVNFIDKTTYVVSDLVRGGGELVRGTQNGNIQQYAMYIGLGVVATITFVLMR